MLKGFHRCTGQAKAPGDVRRDPALLHGLSSKNRLGFRV